MDGKVLSFQFSVDTLNSGSNRRLLDIYNIENDTYTEENAINNMKMPSSILYE